MKTKYQVRRERNQRAIQGIWDYYSSRVGADLWAKAYKELAIFGDVMPDTQREINEKLREEIEACEEK